MLEHTNEPQFSEAFRDREFLITGWERRRESKGEMIRSETCSIHKIAKSILEKLFFLLRRLKLQLSHTKRSPMPCFSQQFTTQSTYPESCTLIRHSDDATRHPIHISCRSSPNTPFPHNRNRCCLCCCSDIHEKARLYLRSSETNRRCAMNIPHTKSEKLKLKMWKLRWRESERLFRVLMKRKWNTIFHCYLLARTQSSSSSSNVYTSGQRASNIISNSSKSWCAPSSHARLCEFRLDALREVYAGALCMRDIYIFCDVTSSCFYVLRCGGKEEKSEWAREEERKSYRFSLCFALLARIFRLTFSCYKHASSFWRCFLPIYNNIVYCIFSRRWEFEYILYYVSALCYAVSSPHSTSTFTDKVKIKTRWLLLGEWDTRRHHKVA